jgi:hypothetical protein
MSTANGAEWLTQHGFMPGMGGPGDMRVGFNSEHMQATLPGGTPFNWGNDAAAANRGIGGTGAYDPAFTSHYFRPTGGGAPGLNWDALSQAEASGNWANKSNPKYSGGLQFDQQTWDAYKPPGAPAIPADATREQQIQAGQAAIQARGGPQSLWPQNWTRLGPSSGPPDAASAEAQIRAGIVQQHPGIPTPQPPGYESGGATSNTPGGYLALVHPNEWVLNPTGRATLGDAFAGAANRGIFDPSLLPHFDNGGATDLSAIAPMDVPNTVIAPPDMPDVAPPGQPQAAPGQIGPFPTPPGLMLPQTSPPAAPQPGQQGSTKIGGSEAPHDSSGASAGGGSGGLPGAAITAAASMFPGAGAAAQIGMQEMTRAIKAFGQYAGSAVEGVMTTFLPFGGSTLAQNSWLTRIAGGFAQAAPALPNMAGQAASGPLTPQQAFGGPPSPFGGQQPAQTSIEHGVHIDNITVQGDQPARKTATEIQDQLKTAGSLGAITGRR